MVLSAWQYPLRASETEVRGTTARWFRIGTPITHGSGVGNTTGSATDRDGDGQPDGGVPPTPEDLDGDGHLNAEDDFPLDKYRWLQVPVQNYAVVALGMPAGVTESYLHSLSDEGNAGGIMQKADGPHAFTWNASTGVVDKGALPQEGTFPVLQSNGQGVSTTPQQVFFYNWRVNSDGTAFGFGYISSYWGRASPVMWKNNQLIQYFDRAWPSNNYLEFYGAATPERFLIYASVLMGVLDLSVYGSGQPPYNSIYSVTKGFDPNFSRTWQRWERPVLSTSGIYAGGHNVIWQVNGAVKAIIDPLPQGRTRQDYWTVAVSDSGEAVGRLFAFVKAAGSQAPSFHKWGDLIPTPWKKQVYNPLLEQNSYDPYQNTPQQRPIAMSADGSKILCSFSHLPKPGVARWYNSDDVEYGAFVLSRDAQSNWTLQKVSHAGSFINSSGIMGTTSRKTIDSQGNPIPSALQTSFAALLIPFDLASETEKGSGKYERLANAPVFVPDTGVGRGVSYTASKDVYTVQTASDLSSDAVDVLTVSLANLNGTYSGTLTETGAATGIFQSADSTVTAILSPLTQTTGLTVENLRFTITAPTIHLSNAVVTLRETTVALKIFKQPELDVTIELASNLNSGAIDKIKATITSERSHQIDLVETGNSTKVFVNAASGLTVALPNLGTLNTSAKDKVMATLSGADLPSEVTYVLEEKANDAKAFANFTQSSTNITPVNPAQSHDGVFYIRMGKMGSDTALPPSSSRSITKRKWKWQ